MPRLLFATALLASAVLAMLALIQPPVVPAALAFVFKPLTTVLILVWAWPRGGGQPRLAQRLKLGLLFSLAGDVFLLWPESGFLPGLLSFLIAHLLYIAAFCSQARLAARVWPFVVFGVIAAMVLGRLWPGVPTALQIPVLVYVACLASMAAQAWVWWRGSLGGADEAGARRAAWGGTLFVLSDALLAINKFAGPLPLAAVWVLSSYWAAQYCIASSLAPARGSDPA